MSVVRSRGLVPAPVLALLLLILLPIRTPAQTFSDPDFGAAPVVTLPPFQLVGMTWAPDGRMFIWQKNGIVRIYQGGALLPTPFLDFSNKVNTVQDCGMLGLALDPNFAANGYVYLAYVYEGGGNPNDPGPKISRLTRVTADPGSPNVMLAGSEVILIDNLPVDAGGHAVGTVRFAADGTLFLSNGDGSSAGITDSRALGALDLDSPRGKILRVNPDGSAPAPPQTTNPFYDGTNSIRSKVFAYGLRNPFRFDFHPTLGYPYAGDVGWKEFEEINRIPGGGNYGWPCYEGVDKQPQYHADFLNTCNSLAPAGSVVPPLYSYGHPDGGGAVVGGAFYTGNAYPPAYLNNFFFADYVQGWMRRLVLNPDGSIAQNLLFATDVGAPVTTAVGPDGLLYYADFVSGEIRRIVYAGPVPQASASPRYGYSPLLVNFSSAGSTGGPLTYLWNFGDGDTSTSANPSHTYVTGGVQTYTAQLTVTNPSNASSSATVTVTVGSLPPTPTIQTPADGSSVAPGQTVSFSGSASDPDETLGASALSWLVLLHHNTHVHSFVSGTGFTGSFVAENHGADDYYYELVLTATDSSGLQANTSVDIGIVPDSMPPTDPTNLGATAAGSSAIHLSWTASTDDNGVTSYRIERCTGVSCTSFAEIGTSASTTFNDSGLSSQTIYRYRVRASDATGNLSGYSNVASAETGVAPPQPPGLVAAYAFNDGSGPTLDDLSTNDNDGSISGASWTTSGRYGQALSFDGVNDLVVVPDSNSLDLSTGATFEAWVYPTSALSNWKAILQKEVDAYFLMASTSANRPGIGGTFAGVCCTTLSGPSALPVNQWSHVAGTYDGSTLRLYVNATQVATQSRTGSFQVNSLALRIGGNTYGGEFFAGRIDELRIYDRALSVSEIQSDMSTPLPEPGGFPALLAGVAALGWLHGRARGDRRDARADLRVER